MKPGAKVLDVGSGSGYLTHVLAELVKPGGHVVGIDHIQPLVDMSLANVRKSAEGRSLLDSGAMAFFKGDGRMGWSALAPYDAIHVGACAKEAHQGLIDQLKAPGRMFIPIEERYGDQYIYVIDKDHNGNITKTKEFGVRYVPLTDAPSA
ncbi:hypothetical protein AMS68_005895 [Peltaster fructicola]|uniref:protein-L-isoaspartate(D-aspartate) O-methyltransferase n=1 Tax=Peltaster fructicola TaxID=286661 RepID=A0A6H0Y0K8_9PEZI|nr:hypothetical protein AMS68_005895 [Peltaster fructicola]